MDQWRLRRRGRARTLALPVRPVVGVLDPGLDNEPHAGRSDDPRGGDGFGFHGLGLFVRLERVGFFGLRFYRFGFDGIGHERFRFELRLDGLRLDRVGFDGFRFVHDGSDRFWNFGNDELHGRRCKRPHDGHGLPQRRVEELFDAEVQESEAM